MILVLNFTKYFWLEIKDLVIASLNEGYHNQKKRRSFPQRQGLITLLFKKGDRGFGDLFHIKYYL